MMMNNPYISIVLCAHNRASMIGQTIDCILSQKINYPFELIISEDCSRDKTREICLKYQKTYPEIVKVIAHDVNCGLGKNWAILVKEAKGKYIASCDDDDYWHNPDKLKLQVDFLENNTDYGVVHTDCDILDMRNNKIYPSYYLKNKVKIKTGYITKEIFTGKSPICVSSSMFRKELINKYVPLDLYIEHKFNIQDWPTWMILSKYSKIGFLPVSTTTYRKGHYAISNYGSLEKTESKVEIDHKMYKIICELLPKDVKYNEHHYNRYKLNILLSAAYKKFKFKKAREYITKYNGDKYSSLKIKMAKTKFFFYIYSYLLYLNRFIRERIK